jgi:hypothetical protein
MDLKKELLKGQSKAFTDKIVRYVGADQIRFNDLIIIFLAGPYRITQRAAWPLSCCVQNHPFLIKPHLGSILKILDREGIHDAVKRNIMRLLQDVDIPKRYQGIVVEKCFELMDPKEPIAVRVFAMSVLANLASVQPDLKNELKVIIEDHLPLGTAAYLSRAKKILRQLKK